MRISRLWSTVPVLLSICLLSWTFLSAHAQHKADMQGEENEEQSYSEPGAGPRVAWEESRSSENQDSEANRPGFRRHIKQHNQQRASVRTDMPYGISVVNGIDAHRVGQLFDTSNPTLNAYTNPNTSGVTFRTSWADVEPEDGKFDFSKIDTVFANAEKNGKWVELILIPGFGTPSWAMKGVQSGMFTIPYGPGSGMLLPLPVPWDQTYLSRWFAFLKVIGDRYAGKTSFRKIAAAGPTSVSAEMTLPYSRNDIVQWEKLGYTSQKYINAWKQTFSAYSSTFPHQYFSLALHPALPIPDRSQKAYAREQIINLGLQYPSQFALQEDGLNGDSSNQIYGYRVVRDYSGQVATGFMMDTAATLRSQRMGAEGNPPLALRKSIDKGMQPNSAGRHVNYLEIYEPDVLADEMQPVLRYGASLFAGNPGAGRRVAGEDSRPSENQDSEANRPGFRPSTSTDDSGPSGLVVVIKNRPQKGRSLDLRALNNPSISGVALQIHWSDIEPVQGNPDWSKLDELFAAAESSKKWVQLLIFPGFFTPAWAKEGAQSDMFPIQYGPGKGTVLSLPMPWDSVYLTRWFAFLKQLSGRYGKSPAFRVMAAAGPTSVSAEFTLPNNPQDHKKWLNDSYTPRKYMDAWQKVFQVYADYFPNQYISLSAPSLPILGPGRKGPGERDQARRAIVDQASGILGRRLVLQFSDLHAGRDTGSARASRYLDFLVSYNGRIITGIQMKTSAEGSSGDMGAEGNPPLALRRSIDMGMQPNNAGRHVNYLEIYEPDVLADEMQPLLRYGASLFARKQHSQ